MGLGIGGNVQDAQRVLQALSKATKKEREMEYKIVTTKATFGLSTDFDRAANELAQQVNSHIASGWKPQGGVMGAKTMNTFEPYLFQALIRE